MLKKVEELKNKYIGLEFGSYRITKYMGYYPQGKSKYNRHWLEKECKFCGNKTNLNPGKINKQIREESKCNLCNESVNIHTKEKKCSTCDTWKPATTEYFPASKNRRFGIHYYCRVCHTDKNRRHRSNIENRQKEWKYFLDRRENDPFFKFKTNIRSNIRIGLYNRGYNKKTKTYQILQCTFEEFQIWIENKFTEGMSWDNQGDWHLDHQIPLDLAETEQDVIDLCHYTNYQPMWGHENLSKGKTLRLDNISEENKLRFKKFIERHQHRVDLLN